MARQFKVPAGTDFPASLADYKLAKQGREHKRTLVNVTRTMAAPYPEIVDSWLANGVTEVGAKEVDDDDAAER